MPGIISPLIGASLLQVWKPLGTPGATSDATAPFVLGTIVNATAPKDIAQFCRIGAQLTNNSTAGITNGVSTTAGAGNTWTNTTGVTLEVGDYAFLTAAITTNP